MLSVQGVALFERISRIRSGLVGRSVSLEVGFENLEILTSWELVLSASCLQGRM